MISSFFQEKDLKNAYVISLINCKTTQIHNVAPDLSKIYIRWGASSMSYEFPCAFKDKLRFADPDLQERVEAFLKEHPEFTLEPLPLPAVFPANTSGMLAFVPGQYDTDGFFISRMRRKA